MWVLPKDLSVAVCEENSLTKYKPGNTEQTAFDYLLVQLSLDISESKQFYLKTHHNLVDNLKE